MPSCKAGCRIHNTSNGPILLVASAISLCNPTYVGFFPIISTYLPDSFQYTARASLLQHRLRFSRIRSERERVLARGKVRNQPRGSSLAFKSKIPRSESTMSRNSEQTMLESQTK